MNSDTLLKIAEFATLESGWCYGEGIHIQKQTQFQAQELFVALFSNGIEKTDAFPGLSGEIRVTGYKNEHYLELTIEGPDCVTFLYEQNDDEFEYNENLTILQAKHKVKETIAKINSCQSLSDRSIKSIGTSRKGDFKVWRSSLPEMVAFQFSVKIAQLTKVAVHASIQKSITKTSQTTPQFTGRSIKPYSRKITKSMKRRVNQVMNVTETLYA